MEDRDIVNFLNWLRTSCVVSLTAVASWSHILSKCCRGPVCCDNLRRFRSVNYISNRSSLVFWDTVWKNSAEIGDGTVCIHMYVVIVNSGIRYCWCVLFFALFLRLIYTRYRWRSSALSSAFDGQTDLKPPLWFQCFLWCFLVLLINVFVPLSFTALNVYVCEWQ